MSRRIGMAAVLVASAAWAALAHADASRGGAFRHPGYGARAWGMGGAAVATMDDEGAVYWNPAMLSLAARNVAGASYINLVAGATARQSQIAYARVLAWGEEGDGGRRLGRHAVGAMYTNVHLGISGDYRYDENLLRMAYAYCPEQFVSFAIGAEVFVSSSDVGGFGAHGSTVDGAIRLALSRSLTLGLVVRDAFSRYSYADGRDFEKERAWVLGVAYAGVSVAVVEGDVVWENGGVARAVIGAESDDLFGVLALRAGLASLSSGQSRTVPYLGLGVRVRGQFALHYNANLDDETAFEDTHRFTLSAAF